MSRAGAIRLPTAQKSSSSRRESASVRCFMARTRAAWSLRRTSPRVSISCSKAFCIRATTCWCLPWSTTPSCAHCGNWRSPACALTAFPAARTERWSWTRWRVSCARIRSWSCAFMRATSAGHCCPSTQSARSATATAFASFWTARRLRAFSRSTCSRAISTPSPSRDTRASWARRARAGSFCGKTSRGFLRLFLRAEPAA